MLEAQFVNPTPSLNYIASVKILIRQHSISRPFQQLPTECGAQKKMTWIMNCESQKFHSISQFIFVHICVYTYTHV